MTTGTATGQLKRENGINPPRRLKRLAHCGSIADAAGGIPEPIFLQPQLLARSLALDKHYASKFAVIARGLSELFQIISISITSLISRHSNSQRMVALSSENESFGVRNPLDNPSGEGATLIIA